MKLLEEGQKQNLAMLVQQKNVLKVAKIAGEEWRNVTEAQRAP